MSKLYMSLMVENHIEDITKKKHKKTQQKNPTNFLRYKLLYTFRAHLSDDNSYNCVYQKQDADGNSHGPKSRVFRFRMATDLYGTKVYT